MPFIFDDEIGPIHINTRGARRYVCSYCDKESEALCDAPVAGKRTCSRRLCHEHATQSGELDYCREHAGLSRSSEVKR